MANKFDPKIAIAVNSARKAGVSDKDIADNLSKRLGFNAVGARKAGFSDKQIINRLAFRKSGPVREIGVGINRGLAEVAGSVLGIPGAIERAILPSDKVSRKSDIGKFVQKHLMLPTADQQTTAVQNLLSNVGIDTSGAQTVPPNLRAFNEAGQIAGSIIPLAIAPSIAARNITPDALALPGKIGGPFGVFLRQAAAAPGRTLVNEVTSAGGSAVAGVLAKHNFPNSPVIQILSQIAGGFFAPASILNRIGGVTGGLLKSFFGTLTEKGQIRTAAKFLLKNLKKDGSNLEPLLLKLKGKNNLNLTSDIITGDQGLLRMANNLAKLNPAFAEQRAAKVDNAINTLRKKVIKAAGPVNAGELPRTAKARLRFVNGFLTRRIKLARQQAKAALDKLGTGTQIDEQKASIAVDKAVEAAKVDARRVETKLWNQIPKDSTVGTTATSAAVSEVKKRLAIGESLPKGASGTVNAIESGDPITSGDLLNFRSSMISSAREARVSGNAKEDAKFTILADGALQDLENLPGEAVSNAVDFSSQLKNTFKDTFAGKTKAIGKVGGRKIPKEQVLESGFGSGGTGAGVRMKQLSEAANFPAGTRGQGVTEQQGKFLNILARRVINPQTGRVDAKKLASFVSKNESILAQFPKLRDNISSAAKAEQFLAKTEQASTLAQKAIDKTILPKLAGTSDPTAIVSKTLFGENISSRFSNLARIARRGGQSAVDSLKSISIRSAFKKASGTTGSIDFKKLNNILIRGTTAENKGVLNVLLQNKVIDKAGAKRLKGIVDRVIQIQTNFASKTKAATMLENPDGLLDVLIRIVGARLGARAAEGAASGASLVAAGAGAGFTKSLADKFMKKLPFGKIAKILERAMEDPKFMSKLLKKNLPPKIRQDIRRQLNAFMFVAVVPKQKENK